MNNLYSLISYILKIKKKSVFFSIFLIILGSISEMITIFLVMPFLTILTDPKQLFNLNLPSFFNQLLNYEDQSNAILYLSSVICILSIFSSFIRIFSLKYSSNLNAEITHQLSKKSFNNILSKPYIEHLDSNSGDNITKLNYFSKLFSGVLMPLIYFINSIILITCISSVIIISSPSIAFLVIFLISIFYITVILIYRKKLKKLSLVVGNTNLLFTRKIQEVLGGIRDVILQNNISYFEKEYASIDKKMRFSTAETAFINAFPKILLEGFGLSIIFIILVFYTNKFGLGFALPRIGLVGIAFLKMVPSIQNGYSAYTTLKSNNFLIDAFSELLFKEIKPREQTFNKDSNNEKIFQKDIKINSLSYGYKKNKKILKNVSLEIKKGDIIGIIGKTGSGKSTFIDVLLTLLYPDSGQILIDGKDILKNEKNRSKWKSIISHVPQEIFLNEDTIKNNIAFGIDPNKINNERIIESAKIAQIDSFIQSLKYKYLTKVGERGINLSGGQKQRIGIARCLYREPEIIILDEATSALDNETEDNFIEAITNYKKEVTLIMVAHRKRSLKRCNRIFDFNNL